MLEIDLISLGSNPTHYLFSIEMFCLEDELKTVAQKTEKEREESQRRLTAKDKLLSKRALHINTLQGNDNSSVLRDKPHFHFFVCRFRVDVSRSEPQIKIRLISDSRAAQLRELAYNPRKGKPTMPIQYTWAAEERDAVPSDDDAPFPQLRAGESLLEIHLKVVRTTQTLQNSPSDFPTFQAAAFTPAGLRLMRSIRPGGAEGEDILTFCTYSFLDFEMHSTPVASQRRPDHGFTSRYALTPRDLCRLRGQGCRVRVELHQGVGGVRFVTHGSGQISLTGATERPGQRITGRVNISGQVLGFCSSF